MRLMPRLLLGFLLIGLPGAVQAQNFPNKPIRMIVSIAAGSVTDVIMRAAAVEMQKELGQPVIIENNGGASGILGAKTCSMA